MIRAFPSRFPQIEDHSHAEGRCCHSTTWGVRIDNMAGQAILFHLHGHSVVKVQTTLPLIPRAQRHGFERTGRTHSREPDATNRRGFCRLAQGTTVLVIEPF